MKLFISWSGDRSKSLALALKEWLPLVLHYVDPWLSEADIEAGQRWADAVAKELEASNFGVLCVTKENLNSPWVLFEAGALAKSLDGSRVTPLLLDIDFREVSGPLAQFQAKKLEKKGVLELVHSLNQSAAQPIPDERYKQLFEALWPELEKKVSAIPKAAPSSKQTRSQAEVLEELVEAVRTMEIRIREQPDEPRISRRKQKFHPMMIRELAHIMSEKTGDPVGILMIASYFREDFPWLYEMGAETYRMVKAGNKTEARRGLSQFIRAVEVTLHGPLSPDELGGSLRHSQMRELEFMLHDILHSQLTQPESPKNQKTQPK